MNILNIRTVRILSVVVLSSALVFTSCDKDDDITSKPVITHVEVGASNSHKGYPGSDLHLAADVEAAGKISTIEVEIHKEDGSGWKFTQVYNEFSGLLNTAFHKHIDIPANAVTGSYHFHFTVTDMTGQQTTVEEELEIEISSDTEAPVITVTNSPQKNQEYKKGENINISGHISDNVSVGGILVALVRADDTQVSASTVIMMQYESFQDKNEINFNASISAGAQYDKQSTPALIQGNNAWRSGDYYILIRTWDSIGNTTNSQQYPVKINL